MVDVNTNPLYFAAIGGLILGTATSFNYMIRGKVTGMSRIIYDVASLNKKQLPQKISIIGGMFFMSGLFFLIFRYETSNGFTPYGPFQQILQRTSYFGYALAGLLVGFGCKLSNGCTSGHGLCGLARFSVRSLVAVITFLLTAIAISTLRHYTTLGPFSSQQYSPQIYYDHTISASVILGIGIFMPIIGGIIRFKQKIDLESEFQFKQIQGKLNSNQQKTQKIQKQIESGKIIALDQILTFIIGLVFGLGLLISGMTRRVNIMGFLQMGQDWNPSLLFVLGCGVLFNLIFFTYMRKVRKQPFFRGKLFDPNFTKIDVSLVLGSVCFGLGWGIGGICPGPAIMLTAVWTIPIHLIWFGCLMVGMLLAYIMNKIVFEKKPIDQQTNYIFDANNEIKSSQVFKDDDNDNKNKENQENQEKEKESSENLNNFQIKKTNDKKRSRISLNLKSSRKQDQSNSQLQIVYNEKSKRPTQKKIIEYVQNDVDKINQRKKEIENLKKKQLKDSKWQLKIQNPQSQNSPKN